MIWTSWTAARIEVERSLSTLMLPDAPELGGEFRQHRLDPVDHLHGVGVGLAQDGQHERGLPS